VISDALDNRTKTEVESDMAESLRLNRWTTRGRTRVWFGGRASLLAPVIMQLVLASGCSTTSEQQGDQDSDPALEGQQQQTKDNFQSNSQNNARSDSQSNFQNNSQNNVQNNVQNNAMGQQQSANDFDVVENNAAAENGNGQQWQQANTQDQGEDPMLESNGGNLAGAAINSAPDDGLGGGMASVNQVPQPAPQNLAPTNAAPVVAAPTVAEGEPASTPAPDVMPTFAELRWVGYSFEEKDRLVRIEIVTDGNPRFSIMQERNLSGQPELVVRFAQTALRRKIRRDVDASEFRSPVAWVRMRADALAGHTDVVMTMRDEVQPRLFARGGNVLLTFQVPERYFGAQATAGTPIAKAELLATANVLPIIEAGSELPREVQVAAIPDQSEGAFFGAPADGGQPLTLETPDAVPATTPAVDATGLPGDFDANVSASSTGNTNAASNVFDDVTGGGNNFINPAGNPMSFGENQAPLNQQNQNSGNPQGNLAQSGNQNADFEEQENEESGDEQWDEESEQFDPQENELDNFDDGEGESEEGDEKFEVRLRNPALRDVDGFVVLARFGSFTVAQNDFEDEEDLQENVENGQFQNEAQQQNMEQQNGQSSQNNFGEDSGVQQQNSNLQQGLEQNQNALQQQQQFVNQNNGIEQEQEEGGDDALFGGANTGAEDPAAVGGVSNGSAAALTGPEPVPTNVAPMMNNSSGGMAAGTFGSATADVMGTNSASAPVDGGMTSTVDSGVPRTNMTLDFRNAPLSEVIRAIAEETKINFLVSNEAGGRRVTMRLQNVPWDTALKAILETNGLGMIEVGSRMIRVDTLAQISVDRQLLEQSRQLAQRLEPTKIMILRVSYAPLAEVMAHVNTFLRLGAVGSPGVGDPRSRVSSDATTNSIIVEATAADLAKVKALVARIDMQTPQVRVMSRIVQASKNFNKDFGISWFGPLNLDQGRGLGFGGLTFPNFMRSSYAIDPNGIRGGGENFRFSFGSINNSVGLDLRLAMLEGRGQAEILQTSDVVVQDGRAATVTAGSTDTFFVTGGRRFEVPFNTTLNVTPRVTADGFVRMTLNVTSNSPGTPAAASADSASSNRSVTTELLKRSGDTVIIGSNAEVARTKRQSGIPWLSSLPIIGALFTSTGSTESQNEMLILVTPTIVNNSGVATSDGSSGDFGSGSGGNAAIQQQGNLSQQQQQYQQQEEL